MAGGVREGGGRAVRDDWAGGRGAGDDAVRGGLGGGGKVCVGIGAVVENGPQQAEGRGKESLRVVPSRSGSFRVVPGHSESF